MIWYEGTKDGKVMRWGKVWQARRGESTMWEECTRQIRLRCFTKSKLWGKLLYCVKKLQVIKYKKTCQERKNKNKDHSQRNGNSPLTHWPHGAMTWNWLAHVRASQVTGQNCCISQWQIGKSEKQCGDQSRKENVTTKSIGHLYISYAKPVWWCNRLTGQMRVSGWSRRLAEVARAVAQACRVAGVSATEGKWYEGKNRMVYIGTEWAGSSSPPNKNSDCPQSPHSRGALDYVSSEILAW